MAIDEALLRCFTTGSSLPILRLYGWTPPALSLGRFQNVSESLDLAACKKADLTVVRRITGGGAIYHADELTYSIVCSPEQIPPATSVKDSFRVLTGFLREFYRRLSLDAAYAVDSSSANPRLGERTAFCFAGQESFDIMINGMKIGGNAQRRLKNLIFQHGSIPIVNRSATGLEFMQDRSPVHIRGTTSLYDSGVRLNSDSLRILMIESFRDHFDVSLTTDGLSHRETVCSMQLLNDKYLSDCWNLEGKEQ
jgi:lipoate-protein ligase A